MLRGCKVQGSSKWSGFRTHRVEGLGFIAGLVWYKNVSAKCDKVVEARAGCGV